MPPLDLPGMYYDAEKKKYFKIAASHTAAANSAASRYTHGHLKMRKYNEDVTSCLRASNEKKKKLIQKCSLFDLKKPGLAAGSLRRELGYLDGERCLDARQRMTLGAWDVEETILSSDGQFTTGRLSDYCYDDETDQLFTSTGSLFSSFRRQAKGPERDVKPYHWSNATGIATGGGGTCGRIHKLPGTRTLVAYWRWADMTGMTTLVTYNMDTDGIVQYNLPIESITSFTAAPPNSRFAFVFGCKNHGPGPSIFDAYLRSEHQLLSDRLSVTNSRQAKSKSDIFALTFVPARNPDFFLAGFRNGQVQAFDANNMKADRANVLHISHGPSATYVKSIDEHRVLVAGLDNKMSQYDIRYLKLEKPTDGNLNLKYSAHVAILQYPAYQNQARVEAGLDIDLEVGIIAAGQSGPWEHGSHISIFSLHGGDLIKKYPPVHTSTNLHPDFPALHFVDRSRGVATKRLWVSRKDTILEYGL